MPAIQEFAQCIVERYDYDQSEWVEAAVLEDAQIISAGIRKQCCPDGAITIGGVFAAMLNITCRMPGMTYFQVRSARLKMKHKYAGEQNFEQLGVFYVTDCKRLAGDLFQISAQDAVGWTDTSALNLVPDPHDYSDKSLDNTKYGVGVFVEFYQHYPLDGGSPGNHYRMVHQWLELMTSIVNRFIQARSGIPDVLTWVNYDSQRNAGYDYANSHVYIQPDPDQDPYPDPDWPLNFPLYVKDNDIQNLQSSARTDSARDYYRYLAELTGGYVYAREEDGALTLGQFGQPEFGWNDGTTDTTQQISPQDVEDGSYEIADYTINLLRTTVTATTHQGWAENKCYNRNPMYNQYAYIMYTLTGDNPFINGLHAVAYERWHDVDLGTVANGLWFPLSKYGGGYTIRPFHATVHKPVRFHLGQRIKFVGFDTDDLLSIVTSIQWNFRGGWKIACGGEDGRSMLDCIRATKGDRVARDLRNTITALRDQS
ncbi:MAG: hypothetical protein K5695_03840 [Oscillospiraceae bacterium]|nr:hypothetical protein [Oscillospiraceae bacterium]